MVLFCGIDPGLKGGVALINDEEVLLLTSIPNKDEWVYSIVEWADRPFPEPIIVALEEVHGYPGMSVKAVSTFMKEAGKAEVLARAIGKVYFINPRTWKKYYKLKSNKAESIELAISLFPSVKENLSDKEDGKAEALLIANFIKNNYKNLVDKNRNM